MRIEKDSSRNIIRICHSCQNVVVHSLGLFAMCFLLAGSFGVLSGYAQPLFGWVTLYAGLAALGGSLVAYVVWRRMSLSPRDAFLLRSSLDTLSASQIDLPELYDDRNGTVKAWCARVSRSLQAHQQLELLSARSDVISKSFARSH